MIVLTASIAGFLLYLIYERLSVDRWRRSIPLVITVTGTRGKSTVTRLLAAVCREDGRTVLAKTTGSEAKLHWPDGSETDVRRRGAASIIEQKSLLRDAARHNVDCLIAEVMSIHTENHFVESRQILKPDIVALTNVWPDHVDALGRTEDEIIRALALDIAEQATVFAPKEPWLGILGDGADRVGGQVLPISPGCSAAALESSPDLVRREFIENLDLVWSVARRIGIPDDVIRRGFKEARQDIGALKIWALNLGKPERQLLVVNGFAANDPESTRRVLARVEDLLAPQTRRPVGLLCLRADRGDRTEQWIDTLRNGTASRFCRIYVSGGHAKVVARRVESASTLTGGNPATLLETIVSEHGDGTVVFGFGNIVGLGRQLVDFCEAKGVVHGV